MEVQDVLASPFQQKLGFHKCFAFPEMTLQMLLSPFQFLRDKDPFLRWVAYIKYENLKRKRGIYGVRKYEEHNIIEFISHPVGYLL